MSTPYLCPFCYASLRGAPVPTKGGFSGYQFFSRVFSVYDFAKDRTVAWRCPDCNFEWERGE